MGNPFKSPSRPRVDPQVAQQRAEVQARQSAEATANKAKKADMAMRVSRNLLGKKALQDEELEGYRGYRKTMGKNTA